MTINNKVIAYDMLSIRVRMTIVMPQPLIGGALSDAFCVTSVCLSCTSRLTRTERPRKTKIGTEVAHVTRDSDTTFKVKGQGHQAALVGCSSHYNI